MRYFRKNAHEFTRLVNLSYCYVFVDTLQPVAALFTKMRFVLCKQNKGCQSQYLLTTQLKSYQVIAQFSPIFLLVVMAIVT